MSFRGCTAGPADLGRLLIQNSEFMFLSLGPALFHSWVWSAGRSSAAPPFLRHSVRRGVSTCFSQLHAGCLACDSLHCLLADVVAQVVAHHRTYRRCCLVRSLVGCSWPRGSTFVLCLASHPAGMRRYPGFVGLLGGYWTSWHSVLGLPWMSYMDNCLSLLVWLSLLQIARAQRCLPHWSW